jgi:hypothetical protein
MALHSSKIGFECINSFLEKNITRQEMENQYENRWSFHFKKRLKAGRVIQKLFGKETTTNIIIKVLKYLPFAVNKMIKATHGKEF